jgi:hypothetical protein
MTRNALPWLRSTLSKALLWAGAVAIVAGCTPSPLGQRVVTPTIAATPTTQPATPTAQTATPLPTTTPLPTATPSPTPPPTPDPEIAQLIAVEGQERIQALAGEAELLCLRYEDTNADGTPEWIAIFHDTRLSAFVLDGEEIFPLEPVPPKPGAADIGFGQYPTCEVIVRDVNVDGVPEIAIFGYAAGNLTLMHLFTWDGEGYRRLGFFSGDAGVKFVSVDGDLEEEIWEGFRVRAAPALAWYIVYTWEDNTYGWTSEHHDWYFTDRPQTYPTHGPDYAVISFYLALNDRDLPGAYDLLHPQQRATYESWALGYATTLRVSAGSVRPIPDATGEERARVAAMVTSWDNERGVIVGRLWNVEWDTLRTDAGWRLLSSTAELLEEWTVTYWP